MFRFLLILFALIFLTSAKEMDPFEELIGRTGKEHLRYQLKKFAGGGIERAVDTTYYNADTVIDFAKTFLGTPHVMRGTSKKGIDCSGLIMVVHKKVGISLPHSSHEQARYGQIISNIDSLKKGDLVFFHGSYNSCNFITHTGIYLGEGDFIHVSNSKGVMISKVNGIHYWGKKYLFGTRFK